MRRGGGAGANEETNGRTESDSGDLLARVKFERRGRHCDTISIGVSAAKWLYVQERSQL